MRFELREELTVRSLISFMYRELSNTYRSAGERHDFWEFAYVDKGEAEVWIESNPYELKQGSIVFYRPNEFHRLVRVSTPNLFIVAFDCSSPALNQFKGRCFRLEDEERAIIARMLQAGINVFGAPSISQV
ncbi:cupin domain-containing protein [Paenibacillus sp. CC-CFT747]|nr:cupin domain-containing protein [Paenibacillus sp. CC-CFT747]